MPDLTPEETDALRQLCLLVQAVDAADRAAGTVDGPVYAIRVKYEYDWLLASGRKLPPDELEKLNSGGGDGA
jgi:hypothetical protein